jgi:tripartite-type tricarboxylate transporter receptor subunit TctC
MNKQFGTKALLAGIVMAGFVGVAHAWPDKPVKLVVPYAPGGTTDILARTIAAKLTERSGQSVVVENRAGAGGTLGSALVAKAPPDGATIVLGTNGSHAVNFALNEKLAYHPLNDFVPIVPVATVPNVLLVRTDSPYKSLADVVQAARAKPGTLFHGGTGIGASPQLSIEVLKMMAKVNITNVNYQGSAPALTALLGGHVQMAFDGVSTALAHINGGRLRALAVSSKNRLPALPNVPSVAETYPGFDVAAWYGIWAPAGTPPALAKSMNAEISAVLALPDVKERLTDLGAEIMTGTTESFAAVHKQEVDKWVTFIKQTGIKTE